MRHKRRREQPGVQMNLTAMLDMAFQLLAFFVLTFRPLPAEPGWDLTMPSAKPVAGPGNTPTGNDSRNQKPLDSLDSLVVSILPNAAGEMGSLSLGDSPVGNLAALDRGLAEILSQRNQPFEQLLIQVGSGVKYEDFLRVVDVCTRHKLAESGKYPRLSFVEVAAK